MRKARNVLIVLITVGLIAALMPSTALGANGQGSKIVINDGTPENAEHSTQYTKSVYDDDSGYSAGDAADDIGSGIDNAVDDATDAGEDLWDTTDTVTSPKGKRNGPNDIQPSAESGGGCTDIGTSFMSGGFATC